MGQARTRKKPKTRKGGANERAHTHTHARTHACTPVRPHAHTAYPTAPWQSSWPPDGFNKRRRRQARPRRTRPMPLPLAMLLRAPGCTVEAASEAPTKARAPGGLRLRKVSLLLLLLLLSSCSFSSGASGVYPAPWALVAGGAWSSVLHGVRVWALEASAGAL